jgi:hypothetical protein
MYKRIFLFIALIILLFSFQSCKKTCECQPFLNETFGQTYTVDLEGDGTVCQQYSYTDTINSMISGVTCIESE